MRARVPGSTSNLGPGFDVLGLALDLHVEVEVRDAPRLIVRSEGEGAEFPTDERHLAARVATGVRREWPRAAAICKESCALTARTKNAPSPRAGPRSRPP